MLDLRNNLRDREDIDCPMTTTNTNLRCIPITRCWAFVIREGIFCWRIVTTMALVPTFDSKKGKTISRTKIKAHGRSHGGRAILLTIEYSVRAISETFTIMWPSWRKFSKRSKLCLLMQLTLIGKSRKTHPEFVNFIRLSELKKYLTRAFGFRITRTVICLRWRNIINWIKMKVAADRLLLLISWGALSFEKECSHRKFNIYSKHSLHNIQSVEDNSNSHFTARRDSDH